MNNGKTIDERLQFLLTSTESLHASCQELHAAAAEQRRQSEEQSQQLNRESRRLHRLHAALLASIRAFLEAPDDPET